MEKAEICPGFETFDADIKMTLKTTSVYAFSTVKTQLRQGFSGTISKQAGQIIQSPPEQASKCVENSP